MVRGCERGDQLEPGRRCTRVRLAGRTVPRRRAPGLWPDLAVDHPTIAAAFDAISIRRAALAFARGELTLSSIVLVAGLAATGLSLGIVLACAGRRRSRELWLRAVGTMAIAAIAVLAGALAARHPMRVDVSASGRNSLDPATRDVLASLAGPGKLTIVRPTIGALEPVFVEIERVAKQFAEHAELEVRTVDPAGAPGGLVAVARSAGLVPNDLAIGGAVIVDLGGRRRVVELPAIATVTRRADEPPAVERLAVEQALAGALAGLSATRTIRACVSSGHAELPLAPRPESGADWSIVAERLRAEGLVVDEVAIGDAVPATCDVLVVAGPGTAVTPAEALAIQTYVRAGKALVVAAPSRTLVGGVGATGLEAVLAADGLGLPLAIAIDPTLVLRELPGALLIVDGYAEHPINAGFANRRATVWFQPRAVVVERGARPLVSATAESWGERDFTASPEKDADDLAGPVAVAAIGKSGRIVAIGSAESLSTALLSGGASAADLWLARVIRFVTGTGDPAIAVAERTPDQVRLVLTTGQRNAIIALSVGGIPLLWLGLGGLVVWWRRRARDR
ncbi:MAG: Gldg family protein [Kofleriaceae bacterium]